MALHSTKTLETTTTNTLLATLGHELRTPLCAVIGLTELLKADPDMPSDMRRELLADISASTAHMMKLIHQLLAPAAGSSGQVLDLAPLGAVLHDSIRVVHYQATTNGIKITSDCDHPEHEAGIDVSLTQQVLINLLSNAIKFSKHGSAVKLRCKTSAQRIRFEVVDEGIGIAPEHQHTVFDSFFRVPGSPVDGTGLGLHISKELVTRMGGQIGVNCSETQGCTFWFEIPDTPPASTA